MAVNRVAITGLGAISCLGRTASETWNELLAGRSGIREGLGRIEDADLGDNRALTFSLRAAREAMEQAGWTSLRADDGVIFATTTGQILMWDHAFADLIFERKTVSAFRELFVNQPLGALGESFRSTFGHQGPYTLLTSACSASTQALGLGAMWIRQGRVRRCLVVGVEVLSELTVEGFRSLQLLSSAACQPFDLKRRGINLSEGAAALCLDGHAPDGALALLSGYGFSSDGFHMTGPQPEGSGSARAMSAALRVAALQPNDIDWVHAHGTGSPANDSAEGAAIHRLFGQKPFVSSTKWSHGHPLAAAGTLESVLIVRALQEGLILPTLGLAEPDPAISVRHVRELTSFKARHVVKNTLGFGGANAALVLSRAVGA